MIGKKIRLNDYKFTYGQETVYLNVIGAFKHQNSNRYIIYSYENDKKLHYGQMHIRGEEIVVMTAKNDIKDIIKEFLDYLLKDTKSKKIEVIPLDKISTVQIIGDYTYDEAVDVNKLIDLTIPKPVEVKEEKPKTIIAVAPIFFALFIFVIIAFFIINPEVLVGKGEKYICEKNYQHKKIPANVVSRETITFDGFGKLIKYEGVTDNIFTNISYYEEFKEKDFYQYLGSSASHRFDDETHTFRLFAKNTIDETFDKPTEKNALLDYYDDEGYTCKEVELDD